MDEALLGSLTKRLGAELGRPHEDDRGTKSTLDDHMGPGEKTALRKARPACFIAWFGAEANRRSGQATNSRETAFA